jgi:hypothetical protein
MEDWLVRALVSAQSYFPTERALNCNRWIASAVAQRGALALHCEDRSAAWRRLIAIAFEDIGPAAVNVVVEAVCFPIAIGWSADGTPERQSRCFR